MGKNTFSLSDVVKELSECGFVSQTSEYAEGVFLVKNNVSWEEIALEGSKIAGGQFAKHEAGVFWNITGSGGWIMPYKDFERVEMARGICQEITGDKGGWTFGANARKVIKWSIASQIPNKQAAHIMEGLTYGYHECRPGRIERCFYFDMKGCYFQLIERLKSPRLRCVGENDFIFDPLSPDESAKWRHALEAVQEVKPLRNAIWGSMLGGTKPTFFYCKGERKMRAPYAGTHQMAGMIIARQAYELTQAAAIQTDARYAQTDGIICLDGEIPTVWDNYGMKYEIKGHGKTHILGQHRYRCGNASTKWYNCLDVFETPTMRQEPPKFSYIDAYLQ